MGVFNSPYISKYLEKLNIYPDMPLYTPTRKPFEIDPYSVTELQTMARSAAGIALDNFMKALTEAPLLARSELSGRRAEAGEILLEAAKQAIQKKTGNTAETLKARALAPPAGRGGITAVGIVGDKVAKFLITGTKPHPIAARYAEFLRFYWENGPDGARVYYFKSVHHPGTKAADWRPRAIGIAVPKIRALGLDAAKVVARNIRRKVE